MSIIKPASRALCLLCTATLAAYLPIEGGSELSIAIIAFGVAFFATVGWE